MVGDSVVLGIVSLFPILLPGISLGPRQYLFGDNSGGVKQVCVCVCACVRAWRQGFALYKYFYYYH